MDWHSFWSVIFFCSDKDDLSVRDIYEIRKQEEPEKVQHCIKQKIEKDTGV